MIRAYRRLVNWYLNLSLTKKIYLPNFVIILLMIFASVYVANDVASDTMTEWISDSTNQSLEIIVQSLNGVLDSVEKAGVTVANDQVIQSVLGKLQDASPTENTDHYFLVRSTLQKVTYLGSVIDRVTIYTRDGVRVGTGSVTADELSSPAVLNKRLVDAAVQNSSKSIWLDPRNRSYSGFEPGLTGLTMLRAIRRGSNGPILGILEITLSERIFSSLYRHLDFGRTGRFFIVGKNNVIVFPDARYQGEYSQLVRESYIGWSQEEPRQERISSTAEGELLVVSTPLDRLGWSVLGIVPVRELREFGRRFTHVIYLIGALAVALEFAFVVLMTRAVSKPIVALSESMSDASTGDLSIRLETESKDEVGDLKRSFNNLLEQMSSLMDRVYLQHRRERELELMALQSQISPHFLYNTLESISALAQLERNTDAYNLSKSLSLFYRGVLSNGRPVVNIAEEIQMTRHYLEIQQMRYRDTLKYEISVDEEIVNQRIVKLSLQPLVENAIYHGLKASRRPGFITISGRREQDTITLTVEDNGIGIKPDRIDEVMNAEANSSSFGGFGLSSVDQRLKTCFGQEYGISIESQDGEWTKVSIRVPFEHETGDGSI